MINQIRSPVDAHIQQPAEDSPEGFAHLFIVNIANRNKIEVETGIGNRMATITNDKEWLIPNKIKKLILEHHMAATRLGFNDFYEALNSADNYRTGLLDGTLSSTQVFTKIILPIIVAYKNSDNNEVMRLIKQYSPLMDREAIRISENQFLMLDDVRKKVESLTNLWNDGATPTIVVVAERVKEDGLFPLPDVLSIILSRKKQEVQKDANEEQTSDDDIAENAGSRGEQEITAWENALKCSFSEVANYQDYISESSGFGTHQGVKGLEFARVMVILDDEAARGNLFKYERLLGVEALSERDLTNQREGKETTIERTRRLLYVGCSRAVGSLALVAYTNDPEKLAKTVVDLGWFSEGEIDKI